MSYENPQLQLIQKISLPLILSLTAVFVLLYFADRETYLYILKEDQIVEWLTFLFLVFSAGIALAMVVNIQTKYGYLHWFFSFLFIFFVLAGLEEISWGQRLFGWETKGVFAKYSDQHETNLHNTFQGFFKMKTKTIALIVLSAYGVLTPWIATIKKVQHTISKYKQLIIPPTFLTSGFLIASLMMLDMPTKSEEEIGEFLYSICFFLMGLYNYKLVKHSHFFAP